MQRVSRDDHNHRRWMATNYVVFGTIFFSV